jgi:outer membrane protein assembly factor BamE (lipoprotein component of BamABCDE complex)
MNAKALFSGFVAAALLAGCSTTGRKVPQAQLDSIRAGDTKADVQARIGAPNQVNRTLTGDETWVYSYSRSTPNQKWLVPVVGPFMGSKNVESQSVTVTFDQTGRVVDVASTYGGTDAQGRPVTTSTGAANSTTTTTTTTVTPSP